jgi:DNA-binding MarR family transcriptional regulator
MIEIPGRQKLILICLEKEVWRPTDLAKHLEMQRTNIHRELKALIKVEYVKSFKTEQDKRDTFYTPTEKGRTYLNLIGSQ